MEAVNEVIGNIVHLSGYSVSQEHVMPSLVISQIRFHRAGGAQPMG